MIPVTTRICLLFICIGCIFLIFRRTSSDAWLENASVVETEDLNQVKDVKAEEPAPCGEVCTYTGKVVKTAKETMSNYAELRKNINCRNIMQRMAYRKYPIINPPPMSPPKELMDEYTMSGKVRVRGKYINQVGNQNHAYSRQYMEDLISKVHNDTNVNIYQDGKCVHDTIRKHADKVKGRHCVVIGTQSPWLESIMLANKASSVTTLEYNDLEINHTQIDIYTPYDYANLYLEDLMPQFDFVASFSSLEHSGLGRYSDPINPYGDLEAMAQVWCMLKPGSMFVVGVPGGTEDQLVWNAHRIYSSLRLPQLTANWQVEETIYCNFHTLLVLTKPLE